MKEYVQRPCKDADEALLEYSPLTRRLLCVRNITRKEEAEAFLHPIWDRDVHDPFSMKDALRVVERIVRAITAGELIAIWSDYDMDGIPGAVVLFDFFRKIGYARVVHHTPHRNRDGFGLNHAGIEELASQGVSLIITVDCGIGDVVPIVFACEHNIDVVITDHHIPHETLPPAYAIINPKQEDCLYAEKMLCGAGVVFKLVQAILQYLKEHPVDGIVLPPLGWEKWLLDMVGMATVADMVPLLGENRAFAHYGLLVLRKSRRPGLQALLKKAKTNQHTISEDDVSFTIAPRINAASRMGHASDAFKLLISENALDAGVYAETLDVINTERKSSVASMKREITRKLENRGTLSPVVVLGNPEWKPSLLGLAASSVADEYNRPVFLWGRADGVFLKGSCRSGGMCNVFLLMKQCGDRFMEFGGHAYSGGFTLEEDQVHALEQELSKAYLDMIVTQKDQVNYYDDTLTLDEVTWETYRMIEQFGPFGQGNEKPLFLFKQVEVSSVRLFGKGSEHLEVVFIKRGGGVIKGIRFYTSPEAFGVTLEKGCKVSLIAHFEVSNFGGRNELRLRIVDIGA